jgi:hypothetical protein
MCSNCKGDYENPEEPKAFPTYSYSESMRFEAYVPGELDSESNFVRGFGATEEEALEDYWEQREAREAKRQVEQALFRNGGLRNFLTERRGS